MPSTDDSVFEVSPSCCMESSSLLRLTADCGIFIWRIPVVGTLNWKSSCCWFWRRDEGSGWGEGASFEASVNSAGVGCVYDTCSGDGLCLLRFDGTLSLGWAVESWGTLRLLLLKEGDSGRLVALCDIFDATGYPGVSLIAGGTCKKHDLCANVEEAWLVEFLRETVLNWGNSNLYLGVESGLIAAGVLGAVSDCAVTLGPFCEPLSDIGLEATLSSLKMAWINEKYHCNVVYTLSNAYKLLEMIQFPFCLFFLEFPKLCSHDRD